LQAILNNDESILIRELIYFLRKENANLKTIENIELLSMDMLNNQITRTEILSFIYEKIFE